MHSIGVFAVAAASLLSVASAILANAASYPYDINGKLLNDRSLRERAGCNADNVLRALRNPTRSVTASVFCSGYLQSTVTATASTTTTSLTSTTSTSYTTSTAVSTEVDTATSTVTSLTTTSFTSTTTNPTPTSTITATCIGTCSGVHGFGNGNDDISQDNSGNFASFGACQARCASLNALAFGFGGVACACYSETVADFVYVDFSSPYVFYDVCCPAPGAPVTAPTKFKRDAPKPIPTYLSAANGNPSSVSSACSCFITSPSAAATVTNTLFFSKTSTQIASTTVSAIESTATTTTTTLWISETDTITYGTTTTLFPATVTITTTVTQAPSTITITTTV